MPTGKIVKLTDKGYGFILHNQKDVFFHVSGMTRRDQYDSLQPGDAVNFEYDESADRPRAIAVELA